MSYSDSGVFFNSLTSSSMFSNTEILPPQATTVFMCVGYLLRLIFTYCFSSLGSKNTELFNRPGRAIGVPIPPGEIFLRKQMANETGERLWGHSSVSRRQMNNRCAGPRQQGQPSVSALQRASSATCSSLIPGI